MAMVLQAKRPTMEHSVESWAPPEAAVVIGVRQGVSVAQADSSPATARARMASMSDLGLIGFGYRESGESMGFYRNLPVRRQT